MKIILLTSILILLSTNSFPQFLIIHSNIEKSQEFRIGDIDSITFCPETVSYEGKVYNVVVVEDQCWLQENLNVGIRINGSGNQNNNMTIEKYCYNDLESNCDIYGGLYQWNEAMQYSTIPGVQGICPDGWHIPTLEEYQILASAVDDSSTALKAVGQGSGDGAGTNTSGFTALLAGFRFYTGPFANLGLSTRFCSSTEFNAGYSYTMELWYHNTVIALYQSEKPTGFSVRCIMD